MEQTGMLEALRFLGIVGTMGISAVVLTHVLTSMWAAEKREKARKARALLPALRLQCAREHLIFKLRHIIIMRKLKEMRERR